MTSLDAMLSLLAKMRRDPSTRKATVAEFQSLFANWPRGSTDQRIYEVLSDLAHDLSFFEQNADLRSEDPSYYGDERLEREVETAFQRLAWLGVSYDLQPRK